MAKYIPKEGDIVLWKGHGSTRYAVMQVDASGKTVSLQKFPPDHGVLSYDGRVPWSELSVLSESQNARRTRSPKAGQTG
jgi:hypothetical protein